ncbi:LysR family transcriptional regulator [Rouxiella badensis]|jgi:DNA-binding transcriptional LysR family regulator|uniref:LysR family transcriptional regulator n=1 Tax=Rouxiella badensis TaxID=1646377 RepID=UPI0013EF4A6B|nr:LysR family transcriptional regulator [Rouxiella badensis]MCC3701973.1 LysR family transcriptional regulator [Rouxiella badensis]MCC3749022.1 LysR family transcriptional regulator [Rouxiella badensis]QII38712.1 LysR family transcriptional regulator [Rouxiella badensis]QOI55171.1 LysR family transcriptional regulator [Rouxiella badensis subsp. acadiensis]
MESPLSKSGNSPSIRNDVNQHGIGVADLKLLRVFKTVVEAGGFTAACNELNIGLAAISKQISDLEVRFGMKLCTRGREGFYLTEHGKVTYQACLDLFSSINQFRDKLNNARHDMFGELNIGIIDNTITDSTSPIIHALGEIYCKAPKVSLRLHATQLDEIERGVLDGRFTCGIMPVYQEKPEFDYYYLYEEIAHLYCGDKHPLYCLPEDEITQAQIKSAEVVNHFYANHSEKNNYLEYGSSNAVAVQVEAVSLLILTGNYIGFLPKHFALHLFGGEKLKALLPKEISIATPFSLVVKKGSALNSVLTLFLQALQQKAKSPPLRSAS